jgi:DNA-binding transcriptional MerR regulator
MHSTADKSPEAFRTISEVADELDVPQHVLRFWESKFGSVRPLKRGGGRRYYRPEDVDLLRGIRSLLYSDGLTIKGVQKLLRERGGRYVTELGRDLVSHLEAHIEAGPAQAESSINDVEPKISGSEIAGQDSNIHQFPMAGRNLTFERDEAGESDDAGQIYEAAEMAEVRAGLTGSERAYFSDLLDELIEIRARLREARQNIRQI